MEEFRENPSHKLIRRDVGHLTITMDPHKDRQLFIKKSFAIVERLGMRLSPLNEHIIKLGAGLDVENQRVLGKDRKRLWIIKLTHAATGIVNKVLVPIDGIHLANKFRNISHRTNFRLTMEILTSLKFLKTEPTLQGVTDLAEETRDRGQVINGDIAANVDRI